MISFNSFNKISTYINIFHVCPLKLSALMCLYIFQHFSFTVFWHSFNMVFCLSTLFHYYFNINFNIISTSFAKQYFNIISTCISTVFQHISLIWISTFHISTYLIRQVHWCSNLRDLPQRGRSNHSLVCFMTKTICDPFLNSRPPAPLEVLQPVSLPWTSSRLPGAQMGSKTPHRRPTVTQASTASTWQSPPASLMPSCSLFWTPLLCHNAATCWWSRAVGDLWRGWWIARELQEASDQPTAEPWTIKKL